MPLLVTRKFIKKQKEAETQIFIDNLFRDAIHKLHNLPSSRLLSTKQN